MWFKEVIGKIKKTYQNASIKSKIVLIIVGGVLVTTGIIMLLSNYIFYAYEKELSYVKEKEMHAIASCVDLSVKAAKDKGKNANTAINRALSIYGDSKYVNYVSIFEDEKLVFSNVSWATPSEWQDSFKNKYYIGKVKYVTYHISEIDYLYDYVFYVPEVDEFNKILNLKVAYVVISVGMFFLITFLCNNLISDLTQGFIFLLTQMKKVKDGEINPQIIEKYSEREDELGLLCKTFESMLLDLDNLIEDNYVKQVLIRENQIKVLKNQLNPHFLFNTLQMITWQAKAGNTEVISRIVEALGKLLRYSLNEDNDPATVKDEIYISMQYVMIQKMRYRDRLNVSIEIPESLNNELIPKMAIQMGIENSIKYALENMLEPCFIKIWGVDNIKSYSIYILDNGPGPNELAHKAMTDKKENNGFGIGLDNIDKRIKLMFSESYGCELSDTGNGALLEIRLPKGFD